MFYHFHLTLVNIQYQQYQAALRRYLDDIQAGRTPTERPMAYLNPWGTFDAPTTEPPLRPAETAHGEADNADPGALHQNILQADTQSDVTLPQRGRTQLRLPQQLPAPPQPSAWVYAARSPFPCSILPPPGRATQTNTSARAWNCTTTSSTVN